MTAEKFFSALEAEEDYVYTSMKLPSALADFGREADVVAPTAGERVRYLWIGSQGATTELHNDYLDNFFVQIYGTKRFLLAPPAAWRALYTLPKFDFRHRHAAVDVMAPDTSAYPAAAGLELLVADLAEGDVLFLPAYWWHQVEALEPSVSINFWTRSDAAAALERQGTTLAGGGFSQPGLSPLHLAHMLRGYCALLMQTPAALPALASAMAERYRPLYEALAVAAPDHGLTGVAAQQARRSWLLQIPDRTNADVTAFAAYAEGVLAQSPLAPGLDVAAVLALCRAPAPEGLAVPQPPEATRAQTADNELLLMQAIEDAVGEVLGEDLLLAFVRGCLAPPAPPPKGIRWLGLGDAIGDDGDAETAAP